MAAGDNGIPPRTASISFGPGTSSPTLFPTSPALRPRSGSSALSTDVSMGDRRLYEGSLDGPAHSVSAYGITLRPTQGVLDDLDKQRIVRTLPTWIRDYDDDDERDAQASRGLLPKAPSGAQVAQHNHTPASKAKFSPGRRWDAYRVAAPVTIGQHFAEDGSRWIPFVSATAYAKSHQPGERVTAAWMKDNLPDLERPWLERSEGGDLEKGGHHLLTNKAMRKAWYLRLQRTLLRNPVIPLVFRLVVWSFSLIALCLGGLIWHQERHDGDGGSASAILAAVVDAIAVFYLLYVAYDEYSSKPLGLRSPKAKLRLIFLDLIFIIFSSANLSLAFEKLADAPSREDGTRDYRLLRLERALCADLMLALIGWLLTFTVSTLRIVERVSRD